jgi:hypothetical protein
MVLTIVDIPVESLALILNMLGDVCDIQHVFECLPVSSAGGLSALNWGFQASRTLTDGEVEWFAKRNLWVQLLVTHTVATQSSGEPWKERWYLNGKLHRDDDEPAMLRYPHIFSGIYLSGKQVWYKHGNCHRDGDEPAEIYSDGTKKWYKDGAKHRDNDLPAEIYSDGTKKWYKDGIKHRDNDLPAEIYSDGTQLWYQHGKLHRDNGEPTVVGLDGTKMWYQHGELHRDNDLPAVILSDGTKKWYIHGKMHRDGGAPAFTTIGYQEWWIDGHIQPLFQKQPEWKLVL